MHDVIKLLLSVGRGRFLCAKDGIVGIRGVDFCFEVGESGVCKLSDTDTAVAVIGGECFGEPTVVVTGSIGYEPREEEEREVIVFVKIIEAAGGLNKGEGVFESVSRRQGVLVAHDSDEDDGVDEDRDVITGNRGQWFA